MALIMKLRCIVSMLLIVTIQIEGMCTNTPQDISEKCCTNYYKDGDICKECPVGYHGDYCSEMCRYPVYGYLCSETCACSPCHHIYGCNSTQDTTEASYSNFFYGTKRTEKQKEVKTVNELYCDFDQDLFGESEMK